MSGGLFPEGTEAALNKIRSLHTKMEGLGGTTDGSCAECAWPWPCPSYHVAAGWGVESYHECENDRWCQHELVMMT